MAKAGLEMALWDLYSKKHAKSLASVIGGTRETIASGVVVATDSTVIALNQIEKFLSEGYQRFKVKINPKQDYAFLEEIRRHFPDLPLMADANSAYTLKDLERLKKLDDFNLLMIEQPLAADDIIEHSKLQKSIRTPICLDESIVTFEDAKQAIELGSCRVINIKSGRVGGLYEAKKFMTIVLKRGFQFGVVG